MTENRHLRTKNCSLREGEAQLPSSSNDGVSSQVSKGGVKFYEATKPRFNGHHTVYDRWFRFFEPINIRLYHGGFFVAKKKADTYEGGGMGLYLGVGELCFLQLVRWIVNDLKYSDEGDIWFRKRGKSLKYGRSRIVSDDDIPNFLNAPEKDGFYHLYVIHIRRRVEVRGEGESNATVARNECWDDLESSQFNSAMGGPFEGSGEFNSVDGVTPKILSHVDTTTLVDHTTNLTPQPNTQSLIQPRKKLATFSSQKQQPNTQSSNTNVPITEVEEGGEEELEPIWSEDEGGSDVILSEDDYEDQDDDDLFHQFVNHEITEGVSRALGGLTQQGVTGVGEGSSAGQQDDEDEGGEDEGGGADLEDDGEDLVDSDDEKVSIVGSDDEGDAYAKFNPETDFKGAVELSQGLVFPSAKIFRKALQWNAIDKGYNYYFLHNNKKRISVYCAKRCDCKWRKGRIVKCECKKKRKCRFKVHCRKLKFEQSWQIKSYRPTHVCGRQIHNPKLTSKYLAERYLEDFRGDPSMKLKAFIERARRECKCEIGYYKAWHAKRLALEMLFGTAKGEYEKVWDYANAIRENLPGSTAIVKCTGMDKPPAMFERMYICLQPCKEGFIAGCRPIIGVDGAHLRGPFPGILLTAVGKDGNNNIFPVAWAVVEVENTETWTWFLALLRNDLASVADSVTWVHEDDEVTLFVSKSHKQAEIGECYSQKQLVVCQQSPCLSPPSAIQSYLHQPTRTICTLYAQFRDCRICKQGISYLDSQWSKKFS